MTKEIVTSLNVIVFTLFAAADVSSLRCYAGSFDMCPLKLQRSVVQVTNNIHE